MDDLDKKRTDQITEVIYNLLNGRPVESIDLHNQAEDELRQLSGYVNKLAHELQSASSAISDLADGRINTQINSRLPAAHSAKSLQATLKHLTWQTGQVAKGDFTQRVDYLGEFSNSFNWMVEQLGTNRSHLETTVKERTKELSLILETTAKTSQTYDVDLILEAFLNTLIVSFGHHTNCRVALFDSTAKTFQIRKSMGFRLSDRRLKMNHEYKLSNFPFIEKIMQNDECKVLYKKHVCMQETEKMFLFDNAYKSILILTFLDNNKPLGFVQISEARDPSRTDFTEEEIGFYKTITNHLSVAIKNALLFENNKKNFLGTIEALAASIDARDAYTHFHSRNVMKYSLKIAEAMGFSPNRIEQLSMACLLHDIGKIGIRDNILLKPGKLTKEEFGEIKKHPQKATTILSAVKDLDPVARIIVAHHERFDGNGYPNGLAGKRIPLESRIMAIADTLDAMTTSRVYRPAMNIQKAIKEIDRCAGSQFDPEIVDVFLKTVESIFNGTSIVSYEGKLSNAEVVSRCQA